jgi:hypothetical protein
VPFPLAASNWLGGRSSIGFKAKIDTSLTTGIAGIGKTIKRYNQLAGVRGQDYVFLAQARISVLLNGPNMIFTFT